MFLSSFLTPCLICPAIMGLLALASPIAVFAIFSLCAIALDTSYLIPILCKILFRDHPEVQFVPGPFTLGRGWLAFFVNWTAVLWVSFVVVILSLPETIPVTAASMNYAAPITAAVMLVSLAYYYAGGKNVYTGPRNLIKEERLAANAAETGVDDEEDDDKVDKASV